MKLASSSSKSTHNLSGPTHFGIKKQDMSHIIGILRSKIYSNKWLAILREYLTNAFDAHVQANKKSTPVKLTLPTLSSPTLEIRDYGEGLTETEIKEVYIMYGASTKRQSNDYTGCLGIGCKAAFSYTDSFTITSYRNGTKTVWSAVIDDNSNGSIFKMQEDPTTEGDGIAIQVPVQPSDIRNFENEAKDLLPYFEVMPEVNMKVEPLKYSTTGSNWGLTCSEHAETHYRRNWGNATAVMGNIPYKIEVSKMGDTAYEEVLHCSNVIIKVPLGSLDIAANRESLEYTPRTINSLNLEAANVRKEMAQSLTDKLATSKTFWDACVQAKQFLDPLPLALHNSIFRVSTWKGTPLQSDITLPNNIPAHSRKHRYRAQDYVNEKKDVSVLQIRPENKVYKYDASKLSPSAATLRIRKLQADDGWKSDAVYYCIPYDKKLKPLAGHEIMDFSTPKKFLKMNPTGFKSELHLIKESIIDITNFEPYKPARKKNNADGTQTYVKIDTCHLQPSRLASGRIVTSDELCPCNGQHIYIPLDRYAWHNKAIDLEHLQFQIIRNATTMLAHFQGLTDPVIHGVKKHYIKKLDDTWITLDKWFEQEYKKLRAQHKKLFKLAANSIHRHNPYWGYSEFNLFEKLPKSLTFPGRPHFNYICDQWEFDLQQPGNLWAINPSDTDIEDAAQHIYQIHYVWLMFQPKDHTHPDHIREAYKAFSELHPMIKYFATDYRTTDKEELQHVKDYLTR